MRDVAHAVFERLEARILAAEAEDVPGIDEGAASDAALEQVLDDAEMLGGFVKPALIDERCCRW